MVHFFQPYDSSSRTKPNVLCLIASRGTPKGDAVCLLVLDASLLSTYSQHSARYCRTRNPPFTKKNYSFSPTCAVALSQQTQKQTPLFPFSLEPCDQCTPPSQENSPRIAPVPQAQPNGQKQRGPACYAHQDRHTHRHTTRTAPTPCNSRRANEHSRPKTPSLKTAISRGGQKHQKSNHNVSQILSPLLSFSLSLSGTKQRGEQGPNLSPADTRNTPSEAHQKSPAMAFLAFLTPKNKNNANVDSVYLY